MNTNPDHRFSIGLIADIFAVLEKHGYRRPEEQQDAATGEAVVALLDLVRKFERSLTTEVR